MDENEFFRHATLRMCGNLEIEKTMVSTLQSTQRMQLSGGSSNDQ